MRYMPLFVSALTLQLFISDTAEARCCYDRYQRREVVYYTYPPARQLILPPRWSVGMHLTGSSMNHGVASEGLALFGAGGHLRFRHYRWGAELALDMVGNSFADGGIERFSVPIQTSAMLYLVPQGRFNLFLLAGLRFVPSSVTWNLIEPDGPDRQTFVEFGGQVGVGAELLLTRRFGLTADLRAFGQVRNDHGDSDGKYYEHLDESQSTPVPAKSVGLEFSVGASFRF